MKTALVIMAAGIGSRFGGGIKQLAAVGPNGEIIMDYSIHDAIEAGFDKIVFIIRHDIEEAFKEAIGDRIEKICAGLGVEIDYAFQALENVPEGFSVPEGRSKPWGTGQAVLACKGIIKEPFAVINADDYYGKEAFVRLHDFLQGYTPDKPGDLAMAGFVLKNTLSDNGAVTRGICQMNDAHYLTGVLETSGIEKTADGAAAGGKSIDIESLVSMNMWALTPEFVDLLDAGFVEFFEKAAPANPLKAESGSGLSARDYAARDPRAANILRMIDEAKPKPKAVELTPTERRAQEVAAFRTQTRNQVGLLVIGGALLLGVGLVAPASFMQHFIVFVLAVFVGFQVIWKVSHSLHTPLMAITNAISSIIILGALMQIGSGSFIVILLAALAIFMAGINIFGGFLVTRRMLAMFQKS